MAYECKMSYGVNVYQNQGRITCLNKKDKSVIRYQQRIQIEFRTQSIMISLFGTR